MKPNEIASSEMKCKNTTTDEFIEYIEEDECTQQPEMSWELEESSCAIVELVLSMDPSACYRATTEVRQICCTEPTGEFDPSVGGNILKCLDCKC